MATSSAASAVTASTGVANAGEPTSVANEKAVMSFFILDLHLTIGRPKFWAEARRSLLLRHYMEV